MFLLFLGPIIAVFISIIAVVVTIVSVSSAITALKDPDDNE